MKTLLLLRHGKSDWAEGGAEDHERPLARRGEKAAAVIGRFLSDVDQVPDLVVTSTAVRAKETARLAMEAGRWDCAVETTGALYGASPEGALEVIRGLVASADTVLLVGHEPTWSVLAGRLIGKGNLKMPTAGLVRIDTTAERWGAVGFGTGTLVWMVTPRLLDAIL